MVRLHDPGHTGTRAGGPTIRARAPSQWATAAYESTIAHVRSVLPPSAGAGSRPRATRTPVRIAFLLAALALVDPAAARTRCAPGAFVVHGGRRPIAAATGTYDVIRFDGVGRESRLTIAGTCPPARAGVRGRRLTAAWPSGACGVAGRVRLKAVLADDCETLRGRIRRAGGPPVALRAARCAADGVVRADLGEECAAEDVCGAGRRCVDCRCVPAVDFDRDVQPIFQSCLTLACHEGPRATGGFELTPGSAYGALLGDVARAGACAGRRLVVPGDPDASVLAARVGGGTCGARMPLGTIPLAPPEVDTLRAWIAQGAIGVE